MWKPRKWVNRIVTRTAAATGIKKSAKTNQPASTATAPTPILILPHSHSYAAAEENDDDDDTAIFTDSETGPPPFSAKRRPLSFPAWNLTSLLSGNFPDSPSPICSNFTSTTRPSNYSRYQESESLSSVPVSLSDGAFHSQFSGPLRIRPQNYAPPAIVSRQSSSSSFFEEDEELDNWVRNAEGCRPNLSKKSEEEGVKCFSSTLSAYETAYTADDRTSLSLITEEEEEEGGGGGGGESTVEYRHEKPQDSGSVSPFEGYHKLLTRPKPYHEFLGDIQRLEAEAKINAWEKSRYRDYMMRLRKEEVAISEWESKMTRKAMNGMKKFEEKQEKERVREIAKMKKRIVRIQKKAGEKRARVRKTILGRTSSVTRTSEQKRSAVGLALNKIHNLCSANFPSGSGTW